MALPGVHELLKAAKERQTSMDMLSHTHYCLCSTVYVSRLHPREHAKHMILGIQQVKPLELAQQMTLDINNAWGVLHAIIDKCREMPPGKYLILKDPNKPIIRIYKIPQETFEGSGESEGETESEEEQEEGE